MDSPSVRTSFSRIGSALGSPLSETLRAFESFRPERRRRQQKGRQCRGPAFAPARPGQIDIVALRARRRPEAAAVIPAKAISRIAQFSRSADRTRGRQLCRRRGYPRFDPRTDHRCRLRRLQSSPRDPPDRTRLIPGLASAPDLPSQRKRPEQGAVGGSRRRYWPSRSPAARAARPPRIEKEVSDP